MPMAFPSEFLPHVTQVFQSSLIQDITKVFNWRFAPWPQTTLFMRPQDFIEIPNAQPWQREVSVQVPEQSPCVAFFRWIGEAINTSETPFIFQRTSNHHVDVIRR